MSRNWKTNPTGYRGFPGTESADVSWEICKNGHFMMIFTEISMQQPFLSDFKSGFI